MKKIEKVNTSFLPTPLHKLENISNDFEDYNIYIKRDDLTGIGAGGNKLRKLDYIVKKALDEGYTTILTYGGVQTNHGRLTGAACARFGLKSVILALGLPPKKLSGNLLLDKIMGTEVIYMDTTPIRNLRGKVPKDELKIKFKELMSKTTKDVVKRYEQNGEKVLVVEIGGHTKEGLLGYFDCIEEIDTQLKEQNIKIDYVVVGSGSGGTYGGLLLGKAYHKSPYQIFASNTSKRAKSDFIELVDFLNQTSESYEMDIKINIEDLNYTNSYIGIGYNIPDKRTRDIIKYVASKEGIFLDPCYTGKAFMGMLGLIKEGKFKKGSNILFIHTGGAPALWTEEHEDAFNEDLWVEPIVY